MLCQFQMIVQKVKQSYDSLFLAEKLRRVIFRNLNDDLTLSSENQIGWFWPCIIVSWSLFGPQTIVWVTSNCYPAGLFGASNNNLKRIVWHFKSFCEFQMFIWNLNGSTSNDHSKQIICYFKQSCWNQMIIWNPNGWMSNDHLKQIIGHFKQSREKQMIIWYPNWSKE